MRKLSVLLPIIAWRLSNRKSNSKRCGGEREREMELRPEYSRRQYGIEIVTVGDAAVCDLS
jgi:hypothetical protein